VFDRRIIHQNGSWFMSETPVPRDPGQDDDLAGVPAGPGDRPALGSPGWRLVPQSPDWPEWMDEDAHAGDADPGDPDLYEDPDNAPPPGLEDAELEALLAEAREVTGDRACAEAVAARLGHTAVLGAIAAEVTGRRGPGCPAPRGRSPASTRARRPAPGAAVQGHPGTGRRAAGRGDPARVCRSGQPDHPRRHPPRPDGPASASWPASARSTPIPKQMHEIVTDS
jgi:hypothetical protein